mgnify:CR=1 FL=1
MSDYVNGVLLVGTGKMAIEYAKVLKSLCVPLIVVGRSEKSCSNFMEKTGMMAISGGVERVLNSYQPFRYAIVAVNVEQLGNVTIKLLNNGVPNILVEKPGGLMEELPQLAELAKKKRANVYVAYNRRFLSTVRKARQLIEADGGLISLTFQFTEKSDLIEKTNHAQRVKEQWLLANSSHVIDLAFYFGGRPVKFTSFVQGRGKLSWHPEASVFCGSGVTENKVLFSYHANWEAPGSWEVHLYTKNYHLLLQPLEQLKVQKHGAKEIKRVPLHDVYDRRFKPGLFLQVLSFLSEKGKDLKTIVEQCEDVRNIYKIIAMNGDEEGERCSGRRS